MRNEKIAGGCQCGAIRYAVSSLGRSTICHCRMCQKAFGGFYGPFVNVKDLQWTRGAPKHFASSDKVRRGFCSECGTPLTFDYGEVDVSTGSLDNPELAPPTRQLSRETRLSYVDKLHALPADIPSDADVEFVNSLTSNQHPDHDTHNWPEKGT